MPYVLNQAANVMAIAECEWGTAGTIQFTQFTSCIGVLAKVAGANNVTGIHLVLIDGNGNSFSAADVPTVTGVLAAQGYDNTTCTIIGQISAWQASAPGAYDALVAALNNPQTYPLADGTYGATITNGAIELTFV
ncbi:MAG TPA: hypothetical protein VFJ16_12575 [Longimicrobium sp.]|nr:hypothetical protein [Longimicrobium sp.]